MTAPARAEVRGWTPEEIEARLAASRRTPLARRPDPLACALTEWATADERLNTYVSITMKQALPPSADVPVRVPLTPYQIISTAVIIRDRITKRIALPYFKERWPYLTCVHSEEGGTMRVHFHVACIRPAEMPEGTFGARVSRSLQTLHWPYHDIDVRPIRAGDLQRVVRYSLKDFEPGIDAFLPEASFID